MAGNNSATSVVVPVNVTDPDELRRCLNRIIERIDTVLADSGPTEQTATIDEVRLSGNSSAVGLNQENIINTLRDRVKDLERRVGVLER